ncbi:MAG: LysM peptidoglycan-binding domain-containing protein [Anaerolineae bacterium]|nr:LysM peptidoglycan-binding domain-containing protein [Anaerolineae bacterium]
MQQQEVKPYVLIVIIILAIVMAFGVFLTVMYLQRRPPDNSYMVTVDGQEVVVNPVSDSAVIIVPQEGTGGGETFVVEPQPAQEVSTNTPEPPPPPTETPVPPTAVPSSADMYSFVYHTVTSSDTLYSLANLYSTSIALMARFGISSTEMVVGNTLSIPVANPAYCPGYQTDIAVEGDTPLGFSSSAGITLDEFWAINPLANNAIYETQVVCLP